MTFGQPFLPFSSVQSSTGPVSSARGALDLIQRVGAESGHAPQLSAAVIVVFVPGPVLQSAHERRGIRAPFRLIGPKVPIEVLRNRFRGLRSPLQRALKVVDDHFRDLADGSLAHQFAGVDVDRHAPLLTAGLQNAAEFAGGVGQPAALLDGQRQGLLPYTSQPAARACIMHHTRAWVIVSTNTASSFS